MDTYIHSIIYVLYILKSNYVLHNCQTLLLSNNIFCILQDINFVVNGLIWESLFIKPEPVFIVNTLSFFIILRCEYLFSKYIWIRYVEVLVILICTALFCILNSCLYNFYLIDFLKDSGIHKKYCIIH